MTYFKDIINPIIFDGGKNIYSAGLSLKEGKIQKIKIYNKIYEHFDAYFDLFAASLKADGRLILALPNCNSADAKMYGEHWAAYDTPRHLWHFTPQSIEQFAANRGFELEQKYRLPLDPFFNAMVSAGYKSSFTFLSRAT